MKVKVEMIIDTTDFGEPEFQLEIEKLITDIDPSGDTKLYTFRMREISGLAAEAWKRETETETPPQRFSSKQPEGY